MAQLRKIFLLPPLAIARVGGSDTPLEAFDWATDHNPHGGHSTIISPSTTLDVLPDGTLRPYAPSQIRFRDGDQLRPVAPFIELWGEVQRVGSSKPTDEPINAALLAELGASMG